jgi:hypothetical protein
MPPDAIGYYDKDGQKTPMCSYICNDTSLNAISNPKCLSSFNQFVDSLGGTPILWIIGIASVLSLVIISYFFYSRSKSSNQTDLEYDENLNRLRLAAMELDFVQRDLHQHICRVHMIGNNELSSPWALPLVPPLIIRNRVYPEKYAAFAKEINGCYKPGKLERFLNTFLGYIYPPLKPLYNKRKRYQRYYAFKKIIISVQDKMDFWRSYEDQISIELRFTGSKDYTLGYLDFLDTKRQKESFERPPLPMTIMVGGTGHFSKPFNINRHDPLIRSVSIYLEDAVVSLSFS